MLHLRITSLALKTPIPKPFPQTFWFHWSGVRWSKVSRVDQRCWWYWELLSYLQYTCPQPKCRYCKCGISCISKNMTCIIFMCVLLLEIYIYRHLQDNKKTKEKNNVTSYIQTLKVIWVYFRLIFFGGEYGQCWLLLCVCFISYNYFICYIFFYVFKTLDKLLFK